MMTPAVVLDKLLPRWRANLPARYTADYIDGFIARNRAALEVVVDRAMMYRRVKQGTPPTTPDEFAAYGKLAERERPRDAEPDDVVLERITARLMTWKPRKRAAPDLAARRYIEARAVAVLLRRAGLDAVPLLLREPATAVLVDGRVVAVVDEVERDVAVVPGFADEDGLRMTLFRSYQQLSEIIRDIPEARFERYAAVLWSRVRGASSPAAAGPAETPPDLQAKPWRTEANLKAMQLVLTKEPGDFTAEELAVLAQYSGWGGLSIEGVKKKMPRELVPESFGLIHEYYTPTVIAESIAARSARCSRSSPATTASCGRSSPAPASAGSSARSARSGASRSRPAARSGSSSGPRSNSRRSARSCCARCGPTSGSTTWPSSAGSARRGHIIAARSGSSPATRPTASAASWPARTPTISTRRSAPTPTSCGGRSTCSCPAASACSSCPRGSSAGT
jgi:hypothetical protein